jgi:hypothetical protein
VPHAFSCALLSATRVSLASDHRRGWGSPNYAVVETWTGLAERVRMHSARSWRQVTGAAVRGPSRRVAPPFRGSVMQAVPAA